jgi:orotate phosphoribosyltransferase
MVESENIEYLRKFIEDKCLSKGKEFTLSRGAKSSFYFDCKVATLNGKCLSIMVDKMIEIIDSMGATPEAVGGLTMGADFIAAALAVKAYENGHPTQLASIVRKEPKKHGTENKIENQLSRGTKIVVVDDVITSGKSIKDACEEFINEKYEIVGIISLVDRMAGGKEFLEEKYNTAVYSIFTKNDFEDLKNEGSSNVHGNAAA